MNDILTTLLNETRDNSVLLARIDERVAVLTEKVVAVKDTNNTHDARLDRLEGPAKARKLLIGVVLAVGGIAGVAEAITRLFS